MNPQELKAATLACALAGDVVRTFGEIRLRVFGTSMVPSILPGDLISVQRAALAEISSGEIVMYSRKGRLFVHRAVRFVGSPEPSLLITRGDRLRDNDPPVSPTELLGKVISVQRGNSAETPTAPRLSGWKRMIVHIFRNSDVATYLYVRLAARREAERLLGRANEFQRSAGSVKCRA
jgi:signal peptidase I